MNPLWFFLLSSLSFFSTSAVLAAEQNHLEAQLISEVSAVVPGQKFLAGVSIQLEEGWHVYWQNPGDYGDSPRLKWGEEENFSASEFLWPLPHKIQKGSIVSFGYEDSVVLPFSVQLNEKLPGAELKLSPEFKYLVCKEVCVPGRVKLSLNLPVVAASPSETQSQKLKWQAIRSLLPEPKPDGLKLKGELTNTEFVLHLSGTLKVTKNASLYPVTPDQVNYAGPAEIIPLADETVFKFARSDRLTLVPEIFSALLVMPSKMGVAHSYRVDFPLNGFVPRPPAQSGFWLPILFALLGGLLLNLMPCVFPVLSIKAMSLLRTSSQSPKEVRRMGLAYTLGILVSFWLLVGVLLSLRVSGEKLGWGFQLQSPGFVFVLACALFVLGLNLLGSFEFSSRFSAVGDQWTRKPGLAGSFFTGVLATLVATPCSAPFMGSAVGFALSASPWVAFLIFTFLGIGLALPYLLLCYYPAFAAKLPRPGAWMEKFQQAMAFLIFATVLWLAWVLSLQAPSLALVYLLSAFLMISFLIWLARHFKTSRLLLLSLAIFGMFMLARNVQSLGQAGSLSFSPKSNAKDDLPWEKFSPERVSELQAQDRPVFVDFTAAWCVSCQINEALVFHSAEVAGKMKSLNMALLKGDWTNQDPVITQTLQSFHRDGVPLYLIYPKGKDSPAILLPELISAGLILDELEKLK